MNEDKVAEQLKQIQELAKQDKNIDVTKLALSALQSAKGNYLPSKQKRIAYLVSIGVPFVGFYYSIKYLYSDADDALQTALICTILSCACLLLTWFLSKASVPGLHNVSDQQLHQLPQDYIDITKYIENFI